MCEYAATQLIALKNHKKSIHEGFRYSCDDCEYTASHLSTLKQHKESIHKGIINKVYSCDQCEYTGSKSALSHHKKSKHKKTKYPGDQCNYASSQLGSLKKHKESKHVGIRYPCGYCTSVYNNAGDLADHVNCGHLDKSSSSSTDVTGPPYTSIAQLPHNDQVI